MGKFKWRSRVSSPPPRVEPRNNTTDPPIATSAYPSLAVTKPTPVPDIPEPSSHSSVVWAKTLEITKEKLSSNNLQPIDLSNLTPHSAEENIEAVVRALNTLQENYKKRRWSYTWRGKKIIVVENLGKILKSVEKYSKIVDMAVQSNPQVSALVWAGVWAIMRVRTLLSDQPKRY